MPLGMAVITSYLRKKGIEISVQDMDIECNSLNLKKRLKLELFHFKNGKECETYLKQGTAPPYFRYIVDKLFQKVRLDDEKIVGFSILSSENLIHGLIIAKKIKQAYPDKIIVMGGLGVCDYAEDLLKDFEFIDYVIWGKGENSLLRLVRYYEGKETLENVPNLSYWKDEKIIHNQYEDFPLEKQPEPDFDGYNFELYLQPLSIQYIMTEGCNNNCFFCNFRQAKFKHKSFEKIISDIEHLYHKYKSLTDNYQFQDNNMAFDRDFIFKICDELVKRNIKIRWTCLCTPKDMDLELLKKMADAGCFLIQFGLESANRDMLKRMNKFIDPDEVEQIIRDCKQVDIKTVVNFIYDYPGETDAVVKDNMDFIEKNRQYITQRANFCNFELFRHAIMFKKLQKEENIKVDNSYLKKYSQAVLYKPPHNILNDEMIQRAKAINIGTN